ncbi:slipin family protein [bacterium]|nr:MAG: slipin family protein [bacterium]
MLFSQTVKEHEVALRYHNGRVVAVLGPGKHFVGRDTLLRVDTRSRIVAVPMQEFPTCEGLSVRISLHLEYRVADARKAVESTQDFEKAAYAEAQLVLRDAVSERTIEEILEGRRTLQELLTSSAEARFGALGLGLIRLAVRDLALPADIRKVATQVEMARREGLASLERARGEGAALRSLANSARLLDRNPALLALRAIQGMERSPGSTVVLQGEPGKWAQSSVVEE